ncbi:unnamed protein product [Gordionus sp. m RMFG-2023]
MYMGHTTMVRSTTGTSAGFTIAEGVHQGSALSPLLFITVIDVLAQSISQTFPWNMIFADDYVILAESKDEMKERLVSWINMLERHGLKVNREKTDSETWPTNESDERSLQTMEMRMLRMIAGVTRSAQYKNTKWYGHTMRRPMNYKRNKVESLEVMGIRKRGRPKLQWGHKVRANIKKYKLDKRDCMNNIKWREMLKELTTRKGES